MVTILMVVSSQQVQSFAELKKGNEDKITYTPQNSVTFYYLFNVNRQSYKQTMKQSDKEKTDSRAAMQNKDFRQAINFAFDRHTYAAQTNGEEGADRILRNTVTPSDFVQVGDKNFGDVVNERKLSTMVKIGQISI